VTPACRGAPIALLAAAALSVAPAAAQTRPGLDCNLFGPRHPCEPYLLYPPGQDLRLTVPFPDGRSDRSPREGKPEDDKPIDNIRGLFAAIEACWRVPPPEPIRPGPPGMEVTVRFSLNRDGALIGDPRFTYTTRSLSAEDRHYYHRAIADGLRRCTPLHFTKGMGGAVAGRPINIRFIETRGTRKAGA